MVASIQTVPGGLEDIRRSNMENAWGALRMIRETIETLGPAGILPSEEAVLMLNGPEPVHEAAAIVDALQKLLGAPRG